VYNLLREHNSCPLPIDITVTPARAGIHGGSRQAR
jgi:hypothetical protein